MGKIIQVTISNDNVIVGLDDEGTLWRLNRGQYQTWEKMIESPGTTEKEK